jgi:hypothetical protein
MINVPRYRVGINIPGRGYRHKRTHVQGREKYTWLQDRDNYTWVQGRDRPEDRRMIAGLSDCLCPVKWTNARDFFSPLSLLPQREDKQ